MWYLDRAKALNLMAHKDSELSVEKGVATMILGENRDDDGQESNGAGKSAIQEILSIALLGEPLRKVSLKKIVRRGEDHSLVRILLKNSDTDQILGVTRKFYSNTKPQELEIRIDDKALEFVSVNDGNQKILDILGISKKDIQNYFIVSSERYLAFPSAGDTEKKSIVSRFSNATIVDPADERVKQAVSEVDSEIENLRLKIAKNEGQVELLKEKASDQPSLKELEERRAVKIKQIKEEIEEVEEERSPFAKKYEEACEELEDLKKSVPKVDFKDLNEKLEEIESIKKETRKIEQEVESEIKEIRKFKFELESKVEEAIKCPECGHEFSLKDKTFDIEKALKTIKVSQQELKELAIQIDEANNTYATLDSKRSEAEQQIAEKRKLTIEFEKKIDDKNRSIRELKRNIDRFNDQIEGLNESMNRVKEYDVHSSVNDFKQDIEKLEEEIENLTQQESDTLDKKHSIEAWRTNFKRFKTYLTNKAVGAIEHQVNEVLSESKSNIRVRIEGYKEKSDGSLMEKITTFILKDGIECDEFDSLSSGEKVRVEVAFIIALQNIINSNSSSGGLDLTFLDEITNSLDSKGIENMMNMLNDFDRCFYVITHSKFEKSYPQKLTVVKENGICKIEN